HRICAALARRQMKLRYVSHAHLAHAFDRAHLLAISRPEDSIPEPVCDAEIDCGKLVVDLMMNIELSVPGIADVEVMMDVMQRAISDESGDYASHESQNKAKF